MHLFFVSPKSFSPRSRDALAFLESLISFINNILCKGNSPLKYRWPYSVRQLSLLKAQAAHTALGYPLSQFHAPKSPVRCFIAHEIPVTFSMIKTKKQKYLFRVPLPLAGTPVTKWTRTPAVPLCGGTN